MSNISCPVYFKNGKVIDEYMTNVEKILHSKKLKYSELINLTDPYFKDLKDETINLYIDLFDILKPLYSPLLIDEFRTIRTNTKMNIISEILNIVGHYRHFFFSRYGKFTTIILYYSTKEDNYYTSIDKDYKKSFYNKRLINKNSEYFIVNKVLSDCLSIVKEYLNYIPHAYLIDTGYLDPRLLPYMIKNEITSEDTNNLINPDDFTIIMTNNNLSLLDLIYNKDSIIFRHNYNSKKFLNSEDIYSELKLDNDIGLPSNYIKYILSISGDASYDIKNVNKMKHKKAFKYISKKFIDNEISVDNIINNFNQDDKIQFKNNILLIDYKTYPFNDFKKNNILKQFIDIIDFEYIKQETFNTFDGSCIVLLDYLFDGEEF